MVMLTKGKTVLVGPLFPLWTVSAWHYDMAFGSKLDRVNSWTLEYLRGRNTYVYM